MTRTKLGLGLIALVCTTLATPSLSRAAPIDQARWTEHKKFVQLPNGIRMAYVEFGNPSGEPVLLLHGYTDSSRTWSLVTPYLGRHRLLIPDQRGHGATTAPECCYGQSQFAYDAKLFLDALQIKRVGVAGHSMGSMVAMAMAAEYPDRVSRIALLGSTALAPVKRGEWLFDNAMRLKAPLDANSDFMREWHPANQPTPIDTAFADAAMTEILTIPLPVWHGVMRELNGLPLSRYAPDIRAPVLVLSGGKDPLFPPEHHAALLTAFPAAQNHVYPKLGHNFLWEVPADVGERLSAFFAGQ